MIFEKKCAKIGNERNKDGGEAKMRIDKVILRAILSTLAAIGLLVAIMVLSCFFFFPSTLMHLTYNLGMEKSAMRYAERAYKLDGGVYYVSCAFEIAVGESDYSSIEKYGNKLIEKGDEFLLFCKDKDDGAGEDVVWSYEQYVYGNTFSARYKNGEKRSAIDAAFAVTENAFPVNNAVMKVLIAALRAGDVESATLMRERMLSVRAERQADGTYSAEDLAYLDEMIALASRYID